MLPMKAGILNYCIDHRDEEFTVQSLLDAMTPLYGGEKICSYGFVDGYCQDYTMNGFFEQTNVEFTEDGEALITYKITDYACRKGNRFVPGRK